MSEINENNAYLCVVCRVCPLPAARYRYGRYVCLPTYPVRYFAGFVFQNSGTSNSNLKAISILIYKQN